MNDEAASERDSAGLDSVAASNKKAITVPQTVATSCWNDNRRQNLGGTLYSIPCCTFFPCSTLFPCSNSFPCSTPSTLALFLLSLQCRVQFRTACGCTRHNRLAGYPTSQLAFSALTLPSPLHPLSVCVKCANVLPNLIGRCYPASIGSGATTVCLSLCLSLRLPPRGKCRCFHYTSCACPCHAPRTPPPLYHFHLEQNKATPFCIFRLNFLHIVAPFEKTLFMIPCKCAGEGMLDYKQKQGILLVKY